MSEIVTLELQVATDDEDIPSREQIIRWITAVLHNHLESASLTLRIVSIEEIQTLNKQFRAKDKPTNVLAFPCTLPEPFKEDNLGDIALCLSVVKTEALEQNKSFEAHFAHMVIHSTLHLLGYDHQTDVEANTMEALEIKILQQFGFSNPYTEVTQ